MHFECEKIQSCDTFDRNHENIFEINQPATWF